MFGWLICWFKGHKRGKLVDVYEGVSIYACPRCGRTRKYRRKAVAK